MPAVTVEDVLVLPRLPLPDPAMTRFREVRRLVTAPLAMEGEGFVTYTPITLAHLTFEPGAQVDLP